jgi:hypothetical protein
MLLSSLQNHVSGDLLFSLAAIYTDMSTVAVVDEQPNMRFDSCRLGVVSAASNIIRSTGILIS